MRRQEWILCTIFIALLAFPLAALATNLSDMLTLEKTVGLDPGCADAKSIVVMPGTEVVYCYKFTIHGNVTCTVHELEDSVLGKIKLPYYGEFEVPPGGSATVTATAEITMTTINMATWTATCTHDTNMTVTETLESSAKVSLASKPAPALGEPALAIAAAALLVFGALRLSRKLGDHA